MSAINGGNEPGGPTFSVDGNRCIRCGACALLAPGVFRMTDSGSRVHGPSPAGENHYLAQAAVLICPTLAIRNRAEDRDPAVQVVPTSHAEQPADKARDAPNLSPSLPLFPRLARHSELVRWRLDDLSWSDVDPGRAAPALRTLVKEMAFSEHATYSATQKFMQAFNDDVDFTQWLSIWFYEETRHPHALMQWLEAVGAPLDDGFVLRGRVSTPFMKSKMGTLVTNVISEVTAASAYAAMGRTSVEPVLARIATSIAGDEARHAATFFLFARRRAHAGDDTDRQRLDALKVLHFWLNETAQVSHPINQMLERLRPDGQYGQALKMVTFDLAAVQRRVTRLIALLVQIRLQSPAHVLPALKEMTAQVHGQRSQHMNDPATDPR